jgi:hypothetical protein
VINHCRSLVNRDAPLAQPDWGRVDERGARPAVTQVLPAPVRQDGERERRSLRAQTLSQVAALWGGACEQRPATVLALPVAPAAPRDARCEWRPAMARSLSGEWRPAMARSLSGERRPVMDRSLSVLAGASADGLRARRPEVAQALRPRLYRPERCGMEHVEQPAMALTLLEAAVPRYAICEP